MNYRNRNIPILLPLAIIAILFSASCTPGASPEKSPAAAAASDTVREIASHGLPLPEIPDSITSRQARADFSAIHFWDAMNFKDNEMTGDTLLMEQSISDYITILSQASEDARRTSIAATLKSASADVMAYIHLMKLADKYLYTPDSPFHDDDLYRIFAEECIRDNTLTSAEKETYRAQLDQIRRATPGSPAPDLRLATADGNRTSLRALIAGMPISLVVFYDHDCEECLTAISGMSENPTLSALVTAGKIKVLAVDINESPRYDKSIPGSWTSASASGIDDIYVVRNTPSIYAIDRDGNIMLKDVTPDQVMKLITR